MEYVDSKENPLMQAVRMQQYINSAMLETARASRWNYIKEQDK